MKNFKRIAAAVSALAIMSTATTYSISAFAEYSAFPFRTEKAGRFLYRLFGVYGGCLLNSIVADNRCSAHRCKHCFTTGGTGFVVVCIVRRHSFGCGQRYHYPKRRRN